MSISSAVREGLATAVRARFPSKHRTWQRPMGQAGILPFIQPHSEASTPTDYRSGRPKAEPSNPDPLRRPAAQQPTYQTVLGGTESRSPPVHPADEAAGRNP